MEKVGRIISRLQEEGKISRVSKNPTERQFVEQLTSQGWYVTKRGWPDFACFKGDQLVLIEVKPRRNHHLKREQYNLMATLARLGVNCLKWSPDGGFERITPSILDISRRQKRKLQLAER